MQNKTQNKTQSNNDIDLSWFYNSSCDAKDNSNKLRKSNKRNKSNKSNKSVVIRGITQDIGVIVSGIRNQRKSIASNTKINKINGYDGHISEYDSRSNNMNVKSVDKFFSEDNFNSLKDLSFGLDFSE